MWDKEKDLFSFNIVKLKCGTKRDVLFILYLAAIIKLNCKPSL